MQGPPAKRRPGSAPPRERHPDLYATLARRKASFAFFQETAFMKAST
jgi:hypothetical protein